MADQRSTHDLQRDKAMKSEGTGITKSPRTHRFLQNYSTALSTESSCNVGIWCNSYLITLNAACRYNLYKGRDPGLSTALYIFDSARQRGLGEYRPRGDWNFWTNDRCRQHPRASFSPDAAQRALRADGDGKARGAGAQRCSAPPQVWKGRGQHCDHPREGAGATSLTGTRRLHPVALAP